MALWLADLGIRRPASVLIGAIVVIGIVGVWVDPEHAWFGLDAEVGLGWPPSAITLAVPAIWSSLTIAFAGVAWITAGWLRPADGTYGVALGFGLLVLGFAFDELFKVHERLESRSGIDWQLIYVPVAAVALALLSTLAWRLRDRGRGITSMLVAGGGCWALAAGLEYVQWRGDEPVELYRWFMIPEELLELAGSGLFALAAIATVQAVIETRAAGPRSAGGAR